MFLEDVNSLVFGCSVSDDGVLAGSYSNEWQVYGGK